MQHVSLKNSTAFLLPSVLPDMAWLEAFLRAEKVILLDNKPFSRKSRVHRGKIRTPESSQWIHIPIRNEDKKSLLKDCRINFKTDWFTPLWRSIEFNYRNSIFFDFFEADIKNDLSELKQFSLFTDAADYFTSKLFNYLEIDGITGVSDALKSKAKAISKVDPHFNMTSLVHNESSIINSGKYILEYDSKNYLNPVVQSDSFYRIPTYKQHFGGFEPNCCIIDLLFEMGPNAWTILDSFKDS
jgi:hypothetical protein